MKICFKFTLVANIISDVSISRNFNAKGTQNIDLKCKLENYNSTQLPLELELSYHVQIQMRICNIPASEIFESKILGMVCFNDLVLSLHNNLLVFLNPFTKKKTLKFLDPGILVPSAF